MSSKHIFSGVTLEVLSRLQAEDGGSYTLEIDCNRIGGTLTRRSGLGDIVVCFDHDSQRREMAVTIMKKPMLPPTPLLLAAISPALRSVAGDDPWQTR